MLYNEMNLHKKGFFKTKMFGCTFTFIKMYMANTAQYSAMNYHFLEL